MEELKGKINGLLNGAGGKIPYADVLAGVDGLERQSLAKTLAAMKDAGELHQEVKWDAETATITHSVILGKRPVKNAPSV